MASRLIVGVECDLCCPIDGLTLGALRVENLARIQACLSPIGRSTTTLTRSGDVDSNLKWRDVHQAMCSGLRTLTGCGRYSASSQTLDACPNGCFHGVVFASKHQYGSSWRLSIVGYMIRGHLCPEGFPADTIRGSAVPASNVQQRGLPAAQSVDASAPSESCEDTPQSLVV